MTDQCKRKIDMDIKFLLIGLVCLALGIIMMFKHKFYKYNSSDMLFATKLRVFLPSALIVIFGAIIVFKEIKKLV